MITEEVHTHKHIHTKPDSHLQVNMLLKSDCHD